MIIRWQIKTIIQVLFYFIQWNVSAYDNYKLKRMEYLKNKPILFFNTHTNRMNNLRHGSLKGNKLKARNEEKVFDLKTKHLDRTELWKIRLSDSDLYNNTEGSHTDRYDRNRVTYQSFKQRSLSNRGSYEKRTIKEDASHIMISSQSNQLKKNVEKKEPLYFMSANFEKKMNDYLNNVIRKSQEDYHCKVEEIEMEFEKKARASNIFMRNMKKSLRKKNSCEGKKNNSDLICSGKETLRMLQRGRNVSEMGRDRNDIFEQ